MVMQFNQCCCGCSLRTGTIIIGVLSLLGGISLAVQGISGSYKGTPAPHNTQLIPTLTITSATANTSNSTDSGNVAGEGGLHICAAIVGFIEIVISVLLLVGVMKESPKMVYPWIIMSWITTVLISIIYLGIGILAFIAGGVAAGVVTIIVAAIVIAINVYFILIVNSYHIGLKSGPVSRA